MTTRRARQPLSRQPSLVSASADEVREIYSRQTTPISLEPVGGAHRFGVRMHHTAFGPLHLHSFATAGALRAHTPHSRDVYVLALGRVGAIELRNGGRVLPMDPGRFGSLTSPGQAVEVAMQAGHVGLELVIPRAIVESAFTALTGRQARQLRLEPSVAFESPRGAAALRLLQVIEHELEHDVVSAVPSITARLADSLVHALIWAQTSSDEATSDPGIGYVRRVEAYIEAHLADPITLTELGVVSGVSVRALQGAFRAHRGMSPLQYLRARRLERAHRMLASGDDSSVTEVALACSFEHLGRFSVRYRERYGESPADTLKRARG